MVNLFKELNRLWLLFKRGKSIKDSVALGVVGGFLGTVVMSLSNFVLYKASPPLRIFSK